MRRVATPVVVRIPEVPSVLRAGEAPGEPRLGRSLALPRRRGVFLFAPAVACAVLLVGCQKAGPPTAVTGATPRLPYEDWSLELAGSGLGQPTVLTSEQVGRMEMTRLDDVLMRTSRGPDRVTSWRGPALDTVLAAAEVKPGPLKITVTAADGWEVNFTREQLESAIIAVQDGQGRWLAELDETCPLRLVPPNLTANYWLMNVCRISVEPATGS